MDGHWTSTHYIWRFYSCGRLSHFLDYFFSSPLIILPLSVISMSPTSPLFLQRKCEKTVCEEAELTWCGAASVGG